MRKVLLGTTVALALVSAGQAFGQSLYVGGGLAYTNGFSDEVSAGSGSSNLSTPMLSAVFGQRFTASNMFFGWEANADFSFGAGTTGSVTGTGCGSGSSGSYLCAQDVTARFVGVLGTTLANGTGLFGTVGVGGLRGEFSYGPRAGNYDSGSIYGWTAGVGISHGLFNGMDLRGELIYDSFSNADQPESFTSQYNATTLRISVIRKF